MNFKHYFRFKKSTKVNRLSKQKRKVEEDMKASIQEKAVDEKVAKKLYHIDDPDEMPHLFI